MNVVFEGDRDPVQRPSDAPFPAFPVELFGLLEGAGVDADHGVEPVLVQRNPGQVLLDQLPGSCPARFQRGPHVGNRCFDHGESGGLAVGRYSRQDASQKDGQAGRLPHWFLAG